jgi:hypothetical protein
MDVWLTLQDIDHIWPVGRDYDAVAELSECAGFDEQTHCWRLERLDIATVDRRGVQDMDDPDDVEGHANVEVLSELMEGDAPLPPVFVRHHPDEYEIFDGRHRLNAARRIDSPNLVAWVAHPDCCRTDRGR